jgi:protein-S-isoprenylcysteine O-methyltransferase Ste14
MAWLERRIPPPLLLLLLAAAMWGGSRLLEPTPLPLAWRALGAGALAIAAMAFAPAAVFAFLRARTTIDPVHIERTSHLVTSGVFARTRNPMYVALALLLLAWTAWLGQPVLLLGPFVLVLWLTRFQILPEERLLAERFGEEYARYRQTVRRWL